MAQAPGPDSRRRRGRWLSLFFIVHWGAVASYVLPSSSYSLEPVPDWLEPAAALVIPRAVRWTAPLTEPYLDLTGTRQHWTLFAPRPSAWTTTVKVVPYFPVDGLEDGGAGWLSDTLTTRGPRERGHPHVLHHRTHRILFNLGYDSWANWYRGYFAMGVCRTLVDERGTPPDGIEVISEWHRIWIPWHERSGDDVYVQRLGGFDCDLAGGGQQAPWHAYGLPDPVDTRGWGVVTALPALLPDSIQEPVR